MLPETKSFLIGIVIGDILLFANAYLFFWNCLIRNISWVISLLGIGIILFTMHTIITIYDRKHL